LPDAHHFNQAMLMGVHQPLDLALLAQAWRRLLTHPEALRLRLTRADDGWQQVDADDESHTALAQVDLSALPSMEQGLAIEAAAAELQTSLNLTDGPLARACFFSCGAGQPGRLLLVVHHLAVDTVSWGLILEDLQT